jgi:hypothetical protein
MGQKIMLMLLSIIGIASSCKKDVDNVVNADYWYYNLTNEIVSVNAFAEGHNNAYTINVNDSLKISVELLSGPENPIIMADSVIIKFGSNLSYRYERDNSSALNPILISNYGYKKLSNNHHEYKFNFAFE